MKPRKLGKKLALGKTTIVNLEQKDQNAVKGGYWATEFYGDCTSWHPVCYTRPETPCSELYRCPLPLSDEVCIIELP